MFTQSWDAGPPLKDDFLQGINAQIVGAHQDSNLEVGRYERSGRTLQLLCRQPFFVTNTKLSERSATPPRVVHSKSAFYHALLVPLFDVAGLERTPFTQLTK